MEFHVCVTDYDCYCGYYCCVPCNDENSPNYSNGDYFCCNSISAAESLVETNFNGLLVDSNLSCKSDVSHDFDCMMPWQFTLIALGSVLVIACIAFGLLRLVSYYQKRSVQQNRQRNPNAPQRNPVNNNNSNINNSFYSTTNINDPANLSELPTYDDINNYETVKVDPFKNRNSPLNYVTPNDMISTRITNYNANANANFENPDNVSRRSSMPPAYQEQSTDNGNSAEIYEDIDLNE